MVGSSPGTLPDLGVLGVEKLDDIACCRWSQAWRVLTTHFHYLRVGLCGKLHVLASYQEDALLAGRRRGQ